MLKHIAVAAALLTATPAMAQVAFWESEWPLTNFEKTSVDYADILSGGPPKDGIPALYSVEFATLDSTDIPLREPVVTVEIAGETPRAYPLRYLNWHEIVNDEIGNVPIAVTYCPLCNSEIVYDRRLNGQLLSFGVSGKLRNSNLIMYDRETQSWWQQMGGDAIVGEFTGEKLTKVVSWTESLAAFTQRNPEGLIMAEPQGFRRQYGQNPYDGYDSAARPFLYRGDPPPFGIAPLARVIQVKNRAWPMERLRVAGVIEEAGYRIEWKAGMASALDDRVIANSRDIGSIRVFDMAGNPVAHEVVFAFALDAFLGDKAQWMLGE